MSFAEAVYDAVRIRNPQDARSAVHTVVGQQLRRLDPGAEISPTSYFNHTFVPDFVLSWSAGEEVVERDLFLRLNVSSPAFNEDVLLLADRAPLFLGVFDEAPLGDAAWLEADGARSLVTQAVAVDQFEEEFERDSRTNTATREIVRRGRGALDQSAAGDLGAKYRSALRVIDSLGEQQTDEEAVETVEAALQALSPLLTEEGTLEIEQTLHAFWIRHGGAPSHFPGQQAWNPATLAPEALRAILLDLIDSGGVGIDPLAWTELAGHVSAEDIGKVLHRPLYDAGFDHLADALDGQWTAKWIWVDEHPAAPLIPEPFAWLVDDQILGIDAGAVRMFFADDGRHFKDKPTGLILPTLDQAARVLQDPAVTGAALRAPSDDVEFLRREGAGDQSVRDLVLALLADPAHTQHRVKSITARVPGTDRTARVDFDERKIDFGGEATDIRVAAEMAFKLFVSTDENEQRGFREFLY